VARYRGLVRGSRGEASRLGSSELFTSTDAWDIGIEAEALPVRDGEGDSITITLTGGSNQSAQKMLLGTFTRDADSPSGFAVNGEPMGRRLLEKPRRPMVRKPGKKSKTNLVARQKLAEKITDAGGVLDITDEIADEILEGANNVS
jgi:hypothetical protein